LSIEIGITEECPCSLKHDDRRHAIVEEIVIAGVQIWFWTKDVLVCSVKIRMLKKNDMWHFAPPMVETELRLSGRDIAASH